MINYGIKNDYSVLAPSYFATVKIVNKNNKGTICLHLANIFQKTETDLLFICYSYPDN